MARLPRFVLPDHPQHVIVRGNNRDPIFNFDKDYRFYLDKLQPSYSRMAKHIPPNALVKGVWQP